jgi:DNA-directed RNA polymerase specialized sigma24 family protein
LSAQAQTQTDETLTNDLLLVELNTEDSALNAELASMIKGLHVASCYQDDLLQEAKLHLYRRVQSRPGQKRAWYLTSCRFHVRHMLAKGRSVDSAKRVRLAVDPSEGDPLSDMPAPADPLSEVCARELWSLLMNVLPISKIRLVCLMEEGYERAEISRQLGISVSTVRNWRLEVVECLRKANVTAVLQ